MLHVALIGLGKMGYHHYRTLKKLNNINLIGIVDPHFKDIHKIDTEVKIFNNLNELFSQYKIDYCVIASPTSTHYDIALELIKRNVHFMVEKPISHTFETAVKLNNLLDNKKGLCIAVGHIERYNSVLIKLKQFINKLGTIYQIIIRRQGLPPEGIIDTGVIYDLLIHDIDIVSWLFNSKYSRLIAFGNKYFNNTQGEDLVNVLGYINHDNAIVNHIVNRVMPVKDRYITIVAEYGCFTADVISRELLFYPKSKDYSAFIDNSSILMDNNVIKYTIDNIEALEREHIEFYNFVLGKGDNIISYSDGVYNMSICDAVFRSMNNKMSISVL